MINADTDTLTESSEDEEGSGSERGDYAPSARTKARATARRPEGSDAHDAARSSRASKSGVGALVAAMHDDELDEDSDEEGGTPRAPATRGPLSVQENDEKQVLVVNGERISVPEVLMRPGDIGLQQAGLPEAIAQVCGDTWHHALD